MASEFDYDHKMNQESFLNVINPCNKYNVQKQICFPTGSQLLKII